MSKIHKSIAELVGNTPLVELSNYEEKYGTAGHIVDGTLPLGRVADPLIPTLIKSNENNGFSFDEIIGVQAEGAYETARETAKTDGLFLGTSAAAALTAAIRAAKRKEAKGKNIVVIYPDNGYKYLSTDLYKKL